MITRSRTLGAWVACMAALAAGRPSGVPQWRSAAGPASRPETSPARDVRQERPALFHAFVDRPNREGMVEDSPEGSILVYRVFRFPAESGGARRGHFDGGARAGGMDGWRQKRTEPIRNCWARMR